MGKRAPLVDNSDSEMMNQGTEAPAQAGFQGSGSLQRGQHVSFSSGIIQVRKAPIR